MHPLEIPTNVDLRDRRWSVASLLVANLLPFAGVLFLGWRSFDVVFLYWLENVVIGVINVLKMATCSIDPQMSEQQLLRMTEARLGKRPGTLTDEERDEVFMMNEGIGALGSKLFYVPFFAFHYGMFCFVHGVFVCVLLGNEGPLGGGMNPFGAAIDALSRVGILVAVFALAISHLVSFFTNYLGRGEYRQTTPVALMIEPYGRIMVLHMAIVFGAFLATAFGSPVWLLVLLVAGKTWYDLKLHLRSHQKFTAPEALGAHQ